MKQRSIFYFGASIFIISLLLSSGITISQGKLDSDIQFTNSSGKKLFTYKVGNELFIKLTYPVKNIDSNKKETQAAIVSSEIEPEGEVISLTETTASSGIFTGSIKVRVSQMPFPNSSFLEVANGDKLTVKYKLPENEKGVEELIFDNAYYRGPDWTFVNTGANHIVLLSPEIKITIDGKPAEKGIFVSAYYNKKSEEKNVLVNSGGSGRGVAPAGVRWNGQVTAIAIWGTQENKNNGYAEGETFKWKIWRPGDGKIYNATATYMTNDPRISHRDTYTKDGISGLISLTITTK